MTPKMTRCERRLGVTRIDARGMHKQNKNEWDPQSRQKGQPGGTKQESVSRKISQGSEIAESQKNMKKTTQDTALTRSLRRGPVDRMAGAL